MIRNFGGTTFIHDEPHGNQEFVAVVSVAGSPLCAAMDVVDGHVTIFGVSSLDRRALASAKRRAFW
jgi:hypothetical protein